MAGLRGMIGQNVDANSLILGYDVQMNFFPWNFNRIEIDAYANSVQDVNWLGGVHHRTFGSHLKELKFGKRAVSLTFENHITGSQSGVLAKALVATRSGDSVEARAVYSSVTANMRQQMIMHSWETCEKFLFMKTKCTRHTQQIPRGFNPEELNRVLNFLQFTASNSMHSIASHRTGLTSSQVDNSLASLYVDESHILRRFYPEIQYDYLEMTAIPHHELSTVIMEACSGQITDGYVFGRIQQVTETYDKSSFFTAPNSNILWVISINKEADGYLVRMSSFRVDGRLPAGAVAVSVGAWSLERAGQGTNPSVTDILNIFPTLK